MLKKMFDRADTDKAGAIALGEFEELVVSAAQSHLQYNVALSRLGLLGLLGLFLGGSFRMLTCFSSAWPEGGTLTEGTVTEVRSSGPSIALSRARTATPSSPIRWQRREAVILYSK